MRTPPAPFRRPRRRRPRRPLERILILGMTPLAEQLIAEVEARPSCRAIVVGVLDDAPQQVGPAFARLYMGSVSRLRTVVGEMRANRIVVALAERRARTPMRALLESYVSGDVEIHDASEFYEQLTGKLALESLTPMYVMAQGRFRPSRVHQMFSRALSLAAAATMLVLLSPLLALIAAAIKIESKGPVLFAQRRVGAHGRAFTLLKFRTMQDGVRRSEWEGDNRDHVTRVGHWLRKFRLDELPQFVNILRGEMNLVGPRPHPVSNLELFTLVARNLNELTGAAIGCYGLRLVVRPGMTGWAQVRYRYANNLDEEIEKLRYDLYYVKHMSAWLDIRILFETFAVLLRGRLPQDTAPSARVGDGAPRRPAASVTPMTPRPRSLVHRKFSRTTQA